MRKLEMKCSCDIGIVVQLTRFSLNNLVIEPKVQVMIPMYEPLQVSKCEKCGKVIAQPKELIKTMREMPADKYRR